MSELLSRLLRSVVDVSVVDVCVVGGFLTKLLGLRKLQTRTVLQQDVGKSMATANHAGFEWFTRRHHYSTWYTFAKAISRERKNRCSLSGDLRPRLRRVPSFLMAKSYQIDYRQPPVSEWALRELAIYTLTDWLFFNRQIIGDKDLQMECHLLEHLW